MTLTFISSPTRRAVLILTVFGIIFGLVSLVNHYLFRSYAYDLGIYNQALWDYAHLRLNANSLMRYNNLLGDHFTLLQFLWVPAQWVFGSYALLVVQIGALLVGGYGIFRLHLLRTQGQQPGAGLGLLVLFFSTWGIYSALSFDYHDNVVGAMALPWLLYWLEANQRTRAAVAATLLALSKENMALWLVFIGLGLAWLHWNDPARRRWALGLALLAGVYFALVVKFIVPALGAGNAYLYQQRYAALGTSAGEVVHNLFTRPGYVLGLLFTNSLHVPNGDGVKLELHTMILLSGGLALLRRPAYLLMLAPIYGQKLFSDSVSHWGINAQYSIEFVPVLGAALSQWLAHAAPRRATGLAAGAAVLALAATIVTMQVRASPAFDKTTTQFFRGRHYQTDFDAGAVHRALGTIPATARVSATSALVPHLAARPYIYQFPYVADADYIAALPQASIYPLSDSTLHSQLASYVASGRWQAVPGTGPLVLLRRRQPLPAAARRFFAIRSQGGVDSARGPGARQ